jgi:hypothetical protein
MVAMGVASQSIYVPFYMGITDTPEEYKVGKYLMTVNPPIGLINLPACY